MPIDVSVIGMSCGVFNTVLSSTTFHHIGVRGHAIGLCRTEPVRTLQARLSSHHAGAASAAEQLNSEQQYGGSRDNFSLIPATTGPLSIDHFTSRALQFVDAIVQYSTIRPYQ